MSAENAESEKTRGGEPRVLDVEAGVRNDGAGLTPVPIADDGNAFADFDQGAQSSEQSWEDFDSNTSAQHEAVENDAEPRSAFSDSSGSPVMSPIESREEQAEKTQAVIAAELDLWADDDGDRPPPRPETPLAASEYEIARPKGAEGLQQRWSLADDLVERRIEQKAFDGEINNFKESIANRRLYERVKAIPRDPETGRRAKAGKSRLSVVSRPDSPAMDAEKGDSALVNDSLPEYSDDDRSEYFESQAEQTGEPAEASDIEDEQAASQTLADGGLDFSAGREDTSMASDEGRDDTTETPDEAAPRPGSPIGGFYDDQEPFDYYAQQAELDTLTQNAATHDGDYPVETPPTPPSAEILESITGRSLEDGAGDFERLAKLAHTPIMQDPKAALEMKKQMLRFSKEMESRPKASFTSEDTMKVAKIKAAWSSAAAHLYRQEREDARKRADAWQEDAIRRLQSANAWETWAWEQKDLADDKAKSLEEIVKAKDKIEQAAEATRAELDACRKAREGLETDMECLRKLNKTLSKRALPLWEAEQARLKNPPTDVGTQTPPNLLSNEQANIKKDGQDSVGSRTANQDNGETVTVTTDRGTQTLPQTADGVLQGQSTLPSRQPQVSIQPLTFEIDANVRPQLIPEIVKWINDTHKDEGGDPDVSATQEQIEDLIDRQRSFNEFHSALEQDRLLFRHHRLAQHIASYIQEQQLGPIPLAILEQKINLSRSHPPQDTIRSLYEEIASRREEIGELQAQRKLEEEQVADNLARMAAIEADFNEAVEGSRRVLQLRDHARDLEQISHQLTNRVGELEQQNRELASELQETRATVQELTDERTRSPSQKSDDSEPSTAQTDKLTKDLNACQEQTVQLAKSLDDSDSERCRLADELQQCRKHSKELQTTNEQLVKDAAQLKKETKDLQAQHIQSVNEILRLQSALVGRADNSDDSRDGDDDDSSKLRAEIERLQAENDQLIAAEASASDEPSRLRDEIDRLKAENEDLVAAEASASDEVSKLSAEVDDLRLDQELYEALEDDDGPHKLRSEIERLRAENDQLRAAEVSSDEVSELRTELDEVYTAMDELREDKEFWEKSEKIKGAHVARLEAKVAALEGKPNEPSDPNNDDREITDELKKLQDETARLTAQNDDEIQRLRDENEQLTAEHAEELKQLQDENARLTDENARYNKMLNQAVQINEAAHDKTARSLKISTNVPLPLRSEATPSRAHLATPSAVPLPNTPALPTATTLPATGNSLLRPSSVITTPAPPPIPVDANILPPGWLQRERRLQNTTAFRGPRARVWAAIEAREHLELQERELNTESARLEANREMAAREREVREERMREMDDGINEVFGRVGAVVMVGA